MKKILIFNSGSLVYGAERGLINIVKALKGSHEVTVVLPRKGPLIRRLKEADKEVNIKVFPLGVIKASLSPFYYLSFIFLTFLDVIYFSFYAAFGRFDIVCSNSLLLAFPALAAKLSNSKSVWFIREFFPYKPLNLLLGGYARKFCDTVICQSEAIKKELFLGAKAKVVYEPLDKDNYALYSPFCAKKELDLPLNSAVISLISRIHPSKGQYEFIRAIKDVLKRRKDLAVAITGDISANNLKSRLYKRKIEKLIEKQNLDNIFFLGYVEDISQVICASDICVFPFKRKEPFGIAAAEALIFNKKTFFPFSGGLKEVRRIFQKGEELDIAKITEAAFSVERSAADIGKELDIPEELSFSKYENNLSGVFYYG